MADTKISNFSDGVTANATDRIATARSPFAAATDNVYMTPVYLDTYLQTTIKNFSVAGALSAPAVKITGTIITGGSATTTKPLVLVEPSGTTSTGWSTSGTGIGINAASGFVGNLFDAQVIGVSAFKVSSKGVLTITRAAADGFNALLALSDAAAIVSGVTRISLSNSSSSLLLNAYGSGASTGLNSSAAIIADNPSASLVLSTVGACPINFVTNGNFTTPVWQIASGGNLSGTGTVTALSGTSIPAGGTAGSGFVFSAIANYGIFFGSGAPSLSAAKGSLYLRSDGTGISDRAYINTNGSTTWTAIATAG